MLIKIFSLWFNSELIVFLLLRGNFQCCVIIWLLPTNYTNIRDNNLDNLGRDWLARLGYVEFLLSPHFISPIDSFTRILYFNLLRNKSQTGRLKDFKLDLLLLKHFKHFTIGHMATYQYRNTVYNHKTSSVLFSILLRDIRR